MPVSNFSSEAIIQNLYFIKVDNNDGDFGNFVCRQFSNIELLLSACLPLFL